MKLRNIIHNWPDIQACQILGSVRKVMGHNSRLLIRMIQFVLDLQWLMVISLDDYVLSHVNQTELEAARVKPVSNYTSYVV
ncbi:hypothetical protein C0992_008836 [Termitomyces sp. T32_za158]|nr:hypothetical protein C0992_008836 [Termitomyces sp. T32_za158]